METNDIPGAGPTPEGANSYIPDAGRRMAAEAERVLRANPVPIVLGALATGLVIGLLVRASQKDHADELRDRLSETEGFVRELVGSLTKASRKGYKKSAAAVKDSLEKLGDAAHDVEDDYVDPAAKWFKSFWKKCCW